MRTILLFLLAMMVFSSCHHHGSDSTNVVPDTCAGIKPATAAFFVSAPVISTYDTIWDYRLKCDTIFGNDCLFFAADTNRQSYLWHLGAETIKAKSFQRGGFPGGKPIQVSLKTQRNLAYPKCLLPNELKDSLSQTLFFYDGGANFVDEKNHFLNGRFRGYLNGNRSDTTTLGFLIDTLDQQKHPNTSSLTFDNFWPGASYCIGDPYWQIQHRQIAFSQGRLGPNAPNPAYSEPLIIVNDTIAMGVYGTGTVAHNGDVKFRYWAVRVVASIPNNWSIPYKKREARYYVFTGRKI